MVNNLILPLGLLFIPKFVQLANALVNGFPASGPNGAIIHYKPEPDSCSVVDSKKLFLLDSGAQYVDGTTDITRTVHFGEPTAREKECFTRVLQVLCSYNLPSLPQASIFLFFYFKKRREMCICLHVAYVFRYMHGRRLGKTLK